MSARNQLLQVIPVVRKRETFHEALGLARKPERLASIYPYPKGVVAERNLKHICTVTRIEENRQVSAKELGWQHVLGHGCMHINNLDVLPLVDTITHILSELPA